jgi:hypothetical protein
LPRTRARIYQQVQQASLTPKVRQSTPKLEQGRGFPHPCQLSPLAGQRSPLRGRICARYRQPCVKSQQTVSSLELVLLSEQGAKYSANRRS